MREQVTVYLKPDLLEQYRREAARRGISVSGCLSLHLATLPDQFDQMQQWLAQRFDRLEAAMGAVMDKAIATMQTKAGDGLLARAGLEHTPPELLLAALTMMSRELKSLSPEAREQMTSNGRQMLERDNGAAK